MRGGGNDECGDLDRGLLQLPQVEDRHAGWVACIPGPGDDVRLKPKIEGTFVFL